MEYMGAAVVGRTRDRGDRRGDDLRLQEEFGGRECNTCRWIGYVDKGGRRQEQCPAFSGAFGPAPDCVRGKPGKEGAYREWAGIRCCVW